MSGMPAQKLELASHAESSYLEYAMMVVKGRALAQVEDGQSRCSAVSCMPCTSWA